MDSKFFDIPFRTPSSLSDFSCKDGELALAENVTLISGGAEVSTDFSFLTGEENSVLPPAPEIDFALVRDCLTGWHAITDNYPSQTLVATTPSMEYWTPLAAQLLSQFQSEAKEQNLFVAPFYVMAAWRTFSGRYISPSNPVILIPNSKVPLVATDSVVNSQELEFRIAGAICSLYFKMKAPEVLRDWVGVIQNMEIFVSEPLQTYESFKAFLASRNVTTDSWCESLDLPSGEVARRRICTETLGMAWKANNSGIFFEDGELQELINPSGVKFYPFARVALRDVDLAGDWLPAKSGGGMVSVVNGLYKGLDFSTIGVSLADSYSSKEAQIVGKGENIHIVTRPIKLTTGGESKRVVNIYLRGSYNPSPLTFSVYSSYDMLDWWCVARRKGNTVLGFPLTPFRFYRIEIEGVLGIGETLEGGSLQIVCQ